jgi:hypothetical protein
MEKALGSECQPNSDKYESWNLFTFPAVKRRVETLNVLTENGEERFISLDVVSAEVRDIHRVAAGIDWRPSRAGPARADYAESTPLPVAFLDKGILVDFSAVIGTERLELEQKTMSFTAGYAWLLNALPDGASVSPGLRRHLWSICQMRPAERIDPLLEPIPLSWYQTSDDPENPRVSPDLQGELDACLDNQVFYHRLHFLTTNYFALVTVPPAPLTIPGFVLKVTFTYGDSAEEFVLQQHASIKQERSGFKRFFLPPGPFRKRIALHGCLEGHAEHLHVVAPPGTVFTTSFWEGGDPARAAVANTLTVFQEDIPPVRCALKAPPGLATARKLTIATAASRLPETAEQGWTNRRTTWRHLCRRFARPGRTYETMAQYAGASAAQRTGLANTGCFVGGHLRKGHWDVDSCEYRDLVTLAVNGSVTEAILRDLAVEALAYPAHSSTPEAPRYHIVVPLERPVTADEYRCVAATLADCLGRTLVDPASLQPTYVVDWPSVPADAPYEVCHTQPGGAGWLNPDAYLKAYVDEDGQPNWQDVAWRTDTRPAEQRKRVKPLRDAQFKIFPRLISLRRHESASDWLTVSVGILAELTGIFMPAMIALVLLTGMNAMNWLAYSPLSPWSDNADPPFAPMAGSAPYLPWIASLVVAAATLTISRDTQPEAVHASPVAAAIALGSVRGRRDCAAQRSWVPPP